MTLISGEQNLLHWRAPVILLILLLLWLSLPFAMAGSPGDQEISVGSFYGAVGARWCGKAALLIEGEAGLEWLDVLQGRRVTVTTTRGDHAMNCSFDGKWVVYTTRPAEPIVDTYPSKDSAWDRLIDFLWRFEVSSGVRQRFAAVRSPYVYDAMAPSMMRVFLGGPVNTQVRMPAPRWEAVRFRQDRTQGPIVWFRDSSGVLDVARDPGTRVFIEVFGRNGTSKTVDPGLGQLSGTATDRGGRIYLRTVDRQPPTVAVLHRCEFQGNRLVCRQLLKGLFAFDVAPDGGIVLAEEGATCVRYIPAGRTDGECIVRSFPSRFPLLEPMGVSPDGRWLVFVRRVVRPFSPGIQRPVERTHIFLRRLPSW